MRPDFTAPAEVFALECFQQPVNTMAERNLNSLDALQYLRDCDDPVDWIPEDFDYDAAQLRFVQFVDDLSLILGVRPEVITGEYLQDANYHSEVLIPTGVTHASAMRFSYFGDLVTIIDPENFAGTWLSAITALLRKHGYVYVPISLLKQPYTGENQGEGDGVRDWFARYFEW
jgi:hypothetical protein